MGKYLAGKKTYLLAALLCVVVLVLVFTHRLTPEAACGVALFAISGFGATFRSAIQQHQNEVLEILTAAAQTGAAVAAHNVPAAACMAEHAVAEGAQLAQECRQEANG